jgi:hypothetical protein
MDASKIAEWCGAVLFRRGQVVNAFGLDLSNCRAYLTAPCLAGRAPFALLSKHWAGLPWIFPEI